MNTQKNQITLIERVLSKIGYKETYRELIETGRMEFYVEQTALERQVIDVEIDNVAIFYYYLTLVDGECYIDMGGLYE